MRRPSPVGGRTRTSKLEENKAILVSPMYSTREDFASDTSLLYRYYVCMCPADLCSSGGCNQRVRRLRFALVMFSNHDI